MRWAKFTDIAHGLDAKTRDELNRKNGWMHQRDEQSETGKRRVGSAKREQEHADISLCCQLRPWTEKVLFLCAGCALIGDEILYYACT
jgi:hypothetical protein